MSVQHGSLQFNFWEESNMKAGKILLAMLVAVSSLSMLAGTVSAQEKWKPTKTISVIVPWPAGGASDTVARMISGVMEQSIGQRMVIVNTAGGAGAIGTKEVWDKPHDGYTLTGNATVSVGSYAVLGKLEQTHRDWIYYLPIFTPNVICVKGDSPIKSVDDLIATMKAKPGATVLSSAGVGSSGYFASELFKAAAGVTFRHVPYAGGVPAVMAVASGEAEVVMQLSVEVAELLRSGKLRALAVSSKVPLTIDGYGEIPSVQKFIPSFPDYGSYFGLMAPADLPKDVIAAYDDAFVKVAASQAVKDYAKTKGAMPISIYGNEAKELTERLASKEAWILFDSGTATKSPNDLKIPR
jgi:tripartite-type tricarboxylate transporter receptor subunit TctC